MGIVAGDRDGKPRSGAVRFVREDRIGQGIEGPDQSRIRQIFLRGRTDAVVLDLIRDRAIAACHRVVGVDDDLAGQCLAVVAADLRQCSVRHGNQDCIAKGDGLLDASRLGQRTETRDQIFQFVRMARGKEDRMAGLDPQAADGAADVAGADDTDFEFGDGCPGRARRSAVRPLKAGRRCRAGCDADDRI